MDDTQLDRSIRFAAFLIGAVLFLVFGVEFLVSGVISLVVECTSTNYGQPCSGNSIWQILAPVISGAIVVVLAIVFFVLAYRTRRIPTAYSPPPP
jgi:heme/copper-type cytochrome/quinol oxidase subunit 2